MHLYSVFGFTLEIEWVHIEGGSLTQINTVRGWEEKQWSTFEKKLTKHNWVGVHNDTLFSFHLENRTVTSTVWIDAIEVWTFFNRLLTPSLRT